MIFSRRLTVFGLPVVMLMLSLTELHLPAAQGGEFETPTAITNVTIVSSSGTIEGATIVMSEGRILAAGKNVDIPATAQRIDGSGLTAYPGFIDAQSHLGMPEVVRTKEQRERTEDVNPDSRQTAFPATHFAPRRGVRPQLRAMDQYMPNDKALESHRKLGFTTALIAPRDGIFAGTSDLFNLGGAPIRRSVVASEVAQHGSFQTGEEGEYPQTLLGVMAQFRQVLLDAGWHSKMQKYGQRHPSSSERVPTDAAMEALQPLLARNLPIAFEANSDNEINRALDLAKEFNLNIVISGAKEGWKVIDRIKAERVPLVVSLKFDEEPEYGKKAPPKKSESEEKKPAEESAAEEKKKDEKSKKGLYETLEIRKERRRLWEEQVANTIRLHEAGIPFALRTRDFKDVTEFLKNLRMVMEKGLPESAAIAALTSNAAQVLGMNGRLGAIAPAHVANLTLLSKPLADKDAKTKYVFIDGKKIEIDQGEDEKQAKDKESKEKNSPAEKVAEAKPAASEEAKPEAIAEDKSPKWRSETKADRIPKLKTSGNVLLKNATILPVSSPNLQNASILIRNGKIAEIGKNILEPDGVTVIDATGRYIMPGIIDPHSHLGIDGVNEGSFAISAEVRIADTIDPHDVAIYRALAGGATTHHAMHGSANPIGGQCAILKLKYERPVSEIWMKSAPRTIKFALGENVTQANFHANWGKRYPNTRMGVEAVMRNAFESARAYRKEWDAYEAKSRFGQDVAIPRRDLRLEALDDILGGRLAINSHCYRSEEILRLIDVVEEYGIRIGVLHHVLEGYRIAPEIARHGCGASSFADDWAYKIEAYGFVPHNVALMTRNGVNATVNSDSANTIRYMNQEAARCIKWGGLTENEALRLITLNPALQLQIEDRVGSLEVGKDGDLAIFNRHPLDTQSKCTMTIIEGEIYFQDPGSWNEKDTDLAATELRNQHEFLIPPAELNRAIPKSPHRAYAIVGATIHPISGPVIEKGTVVIVEDRIQSAGENVEVPPGAGVINGTGLHVYPGLIDAGSILGLSEIDMLRVTRDFSEIATLNPMLRTLSAVHPHSEHIRIARTAGITTTVPTPGGGSIAGQSSVIHLDGWTAPEMSLVSAFGLHMSVPSVPVPLLTHTTDSDLPSCLSDSDFLDLDSFNGAGHGLGTSRAGTPDEEEEKKKRREDIKKNFRELEEFVIRAKHYADVKSLAESNKDTDFQVDLGLEAMVPFVRSEKPIVLEASTYKSIVDALEFAEKHNLRCILGGGDEAWKVADRLAEKKIPVILGTPLSYPSNEFECWDSVYRCASVLDQAGVKFCFATRHAAMAYNLGSNVGMAVAHGLPAERGEYAITLGAAEILGIADQVGSIEAGKKADLIVTTGSPLQTVTQVTHMFIDGRPTELTSMHSELYEKFKNRPAPKLPPPKELRGPKSLTKR